MNAANIVAIVILLAPATVRMVATPHLPCRSYRRKKPREFV